ncbi:MAG: diaminopimelate epimerase, partial [Nitrospiria bacterium]
ARFASLQKIAPAKHTIETRAGIVHAEVLGEVGERVRVQLPDPFDLRLNIKIEIGGRTETGHFINTSVPHVVYLVDDVDKIDVIAQGRATRHHPRFAPKGTNANFIGVIDRHHLKIRTYERGVENETLACGTGAVAGAIIHAALRKASPPVSLITRGGVVLAVDFIQEGSSFRNISLEGDARIVYKGEIGEDALI